MQTSRVLVGERGPLTDRGIRALCEKYSALLAARNAGLVQGCTYSPARVVPSSALRIVMGVRCTSRAMLAMGLCWARSRRRVPGRSPATNQIALREGGRIVSAYTTRLGDPVWVITEADCSTTTVLLPSEY